MNSPDTARLGLSGTIAKAFLLSEITPLLALVGCLMGLFAVVVTPREEEPQINVTFANVFIAFLGATAKEVEQLVSGPVEQILSEMEGLEHVYSVSQPGLSVLTVQFKVGEPRTDAIVRLYNQLYSRADMFPAHLGVGQPLVKPKGIDDVPMMALTLWTEDLQRKTEDLARIAHTLETELQRITGTRTISTLGAPERGVYLRCDPVKLAGYGLALDDLRRALQAANASTAAGSLVDQQEIWVQAGHFLSTPEDVGALVVGVHKGAPIFLADVAEVALAPEYPTQQAFFGTGLSTEGVRIAGIAPAVTMTIGKKPGENAVKIAQQVQNRLEQLKGVVIPEDIHVTITRNDGFTANEKASTLILKLIFATGSVIGLVWIALGWREALIVGAAVILTLALTLFASWAYGFTINRVSLFALIFSIGILVDDAIVVVENIHRHLHTGQRSLREAIPLAVEEVGGPTILATFTVIAALLPMAFVSGLMGPYMSPIPINASMGMLISLAIAFIFTPWLTYRVFYPVQKHHHTIAAPDNAPAQGFFERVMRPFLHERQGRPFQWLLGMGIVLLMGASVSLVAMQWVVLKMLPFDNKSAFQVVVDMPEGTPLEQTVRVLAALGEHLSTVPEVVNYHLYAGTAGPINFNGLVRQYYLRSGAHMGDIHVNLVDKKHRGRKSHDIALAIRGPLQAIGQRYGANVKVVEIPPGPPVMAPLVLEVYGPDSTTQIAQATQLSTLLAATPDIIDVDSTVEASSERLIVSVDRAKAALLGISQETIAEDMRAALEGQTVGFLHPLDIKYPMPLRITLPVADRSHIAHVLQLKVRGAQGPLIPLSELVDVVPALREQTIYHKDLLPVAFVFGDMAGRLDSPLYGMFALSEQLQKTPIDGHILPQFFIQQPVQATVPSIKWGGEWQVTYETFRDMGIAYGVGMILIYLLVVAQFRSYLTPLIIMVPIPLTLIGVMPGHALLGAQFTATSMIGMIALAGIIVRNSILLVDCIQQEVRSGTPLSEAVIRSSQTRAQPILLTGLAAMLGALFILDDPIFNGLAIALIFGIMVSTLLTLILVPVLYYAVFSGRNNAAYPSR